MARWTGWPESRVMADADAESSRLKGTVIPSIVRMGASMVGGEVGAGLWVVTCNKPAPVAPRTRARRIDRINGEPRTGSRWALLVEDARNLEVR